MFLLRVREALSVGNLIALAIAGFPVALAVAAGQMALLLWLLSPWR